MSPYLINGEKYYRVSEPLATMECENIGYQVVHGDPKRPRVANAVTIAGTYGHYLIAREASDIQGLERPPRPRQNAGYKKIIKGWRETGQVDELLYKPSRNCLRNWKKFWSEHKITPLRIEETMHWEVPLDDEQFKLAGTVDLIGRVELSGTLDDDGFFHRCMHGVGDPMCTCETMDVITFMDWKYSNAPQDSHPIQLAVYRQGSRRSGLDKLITSNGKYPLNYHNWSLLLKSNPDKPPSYKMKEYPYNAFGNFFVGCRLLRDPKPISRTLRTGSMTVKFFCTFCAEKLNCPLNGLWFPETKVNEKITDSISTVF